MTTLEDVASKAGVATSTASRILSSSGDSYKFKESTREKVLRAADELGYMPNFAASALASGKTSIIAIVFPRVYDTPFTALFVVQILAAIEEACNEYGYNVLLSAPRISQYQLAPNYRRLLLSGVVDAVIANDDFRAASVLEPVRERNIPAVSLGYGPHEYFVRGDDLTGGAQLMQHVLELGHRRIGIVGIPPGVHLAADQRIAGLKSALISSSLIFEELPRVDGDFSRESGMQATKTLLTQNPDLTAIICLNDRMAMGAIKQAQRMGRTVPNDLTVVGYDDLPISAEFTPALTTVNHGGQEWGRAAVDMIIRQLNGEKPDPIIFPTKLVVRNSSAPV